MLRKFGVLCLSFLSLLTFSSLGFSYVIGAVGDSVSTGFNADWVGDNKNLSWSTGDSTLSQKLYLKTHHPEIYSVNAAIPGAMASGLDFQVSLLLLANPDYVTVLIGANDLCHSEAATWDQTLSGIERDVRNALAKLQAPNRKVVLVPVPDMLQLKKVNEDNSQCLISWDVLPTCPALLPSWLSPQDIEQFHERYLSLNAMYKRIAKDYSNVKYLDGVDKVAFRREHVSPIDCFHPSAAGQQLISDTTWALSL